MATSTILALAICAQALEPGDRPRVLVLTDISSLTAGVAEPDDGQSLIRFVLYANDFDVEGLVASSNLRHGRKVRPDLIGQVVDAYEKVWPNLVQHDARYPAADALRARIKSGRPGAGPEVPVEECVGPGKDTPGSDWLFEVANREGPRPLWVVIWGGSTELAQALWKARETLSADEFRRFQERLRVQFIGEQDSTGPWIKTRGRFPHLYMIGQQRAYRGMYRGGDVGLVSSGWVKRHIHGHGALGDLYPDYRGGDIFAARLGQVRGTKEGDTPSFLTLVPNGLFDPERPELGSWGGRFQRTEDGPLVDIADRDLPGRDDPDPRMSSVYRWRAAFQSDFAARLDWCVKAPDDANHPPVARLTVPQDLNVAAGDMITLDARASTDPDGDAWDAHWSIYPLLSDRLKGLTIEDADRAVARLRVPEGLNGERIPVLLTVQDRGTPRLTRYGRLVLTVGRDTPP